MKNANRGYKLNKAMVRAQGARTAKSVGLSNTDWFEYGPNEIVYFAEVSGTPQIWHKGKRIF